MRDHSAADLPGIPMIPIARGEGAWLIDQNGKRYLDAPARRCDAQNSSASAIAGSC